MMEHADRPAVLSVGAVLGDSDAENVAWRRAISALGKQIQEVRRGVHSPLRLNVVYHVDGKLVPNEFTGVRTSRFRKKDAHLLVQAAVPPGATKDRRAVLVGLLDEAVTEAEDFARQRGISENLAEIRDVIRMLSPD